MFVLGLDLETTGIDPEKDSIIEIGAAVWDTENKKPKVLLSELITTDQIVSPEIQKITGISNEDIRVFGRPLDQVLQRLLEMAEHCEYIVAHNGTRFDRLFLEKQKWQPEKPWIDTLIDVPYPDEIVTRKLNFLAAEHGFLNPFSHRAIFDTLTMLKVFSLYQIEHVVEDMKSPLVKIMAQVSYEEKSKAKDLGFRWDPQNRRWYMEIRRLAWERKNFPFPTTLILDKTQ